MTELTIRQLKITEHIQTRATTDQEYVDQLAERLKAGDTLPPIEIVTDGENRWLVDGNHRRLAYEKAGKKISVNERKGSREDALRHALSANASHGKRRTNADKQRCVKLALESWPELSDSALAEACLVSRQMIAEHRPVATVATEEKRVGKDGKLQSARKSRPAKKPAKSDKATSFDVAEIEKMPTPRAKKSGAVRSTKAAEAALGKLIRELDALGLGEQHNGCLGQIARSLK